MTVPLRTLPRPRRVDARLVATTAQWSLLALALISITMRPLVRVLGLPGFLINLDALLTPVVAGGVFVLAVLARRALPPAHRLMTLLVGLVTLALLFSWLAGSPRSVASLGLGAAMVLLLPFALFLVVLGSGAPVPPVMRRTLMLLVLLQLSVGFVQYVALSVAQKAPVGADLVDGTTSHNLWPLFALPASLVLVLTGRERLRLLLPLSVVLLAVYAEAKAALIVWLPIMTVVLVADMLRNRASRRRQLHPRRHDDGLDAASRAGIVVLTVALLLVGLWWTPSVQGTWLVFRGHSQSLEEFAVQGGAADIAAPTLRDGISTVSDHLTRGPRQLLLGLGPANTTSHAAEVLTQGAKNGVNLPRPGPVARGLLNGGDDIKFRDAQSSVLGIIGDLGVIGTLLYAAVCLCGVLVLFAGTGFRRALRSPEAWTAACIVGSLLVGGTLLDWPEQASVVLPVILAALVVSAGTVNPPGAEATAAVRTDHARVGA